MFNKIKKVTILADSVYCGTLIDENGRYYYTAKDYHEKALSEFGIEIYDLSSFGLTTDKAKNKFNAYLEGLTEDTMPDYFLVALGGNDCDRPWKAIAADPTAQHGCKVNPDKYLENLNYYLAKIREKGITPIFASLAPIDAENFWKFICKLADGNEIIKWLGNTQRLYAWQEYYSHTLLKLAVSENVILCDVREEFLRNMNFALYINEDGIHLTKAGYDKLFAFVIAFLNGLK